MTRNSTTYHLLILFFSVILCYSMTATFDFTNWDDGWLVKDNLLLRTLDLASLGRFFNPFYPRHFLGGEYLPLRELSYALDYQFFGLNPAFYHIENMLLYAGMVMGVYFFLLRLSISPSAAFLASLFFAVHPVHGESVAWISARKDVLSGLFFIWALERYALFIKEEKSYWSSFGLYLCALLSKYTAFALAPILVLLECTLRKEREKFPFQKILRNTLPFWILTAIMVSLAMYIGKHHSIMPVQPRPLDVRVSTMSIVMVEYLIMLFFPLHLNPLYAVTKRGIEPATLFSIFFVLFLLALLLWYFYKSRHLYSFAGLFFFLALLPVSNLVPSPVFKADRYLLIPSLGYCLFLGHFLVSFGLRRPSQKIWVQGFSFLLVLSYSLLTLLYLPLWKNSETLWRAVLEKSPDSTIAPTNLGIYLIEQGREEEGERYLFQALKTKPGDKQVCYNLGILEMKRKKWGKALEYFTMSKNKGNSTFLLHYQMGKCYLSLGEKREARRLFRESLEKFPLYGLAHLELASLAWEEGAKEEALFHFKKALESPDGHQEAEKRKGIFGWK